MNDFVQWLRGHFQLTWTDVFWSAGLFVVTLTASLALVTLVLVRLPAEYFRDPAGGLRLWADRHPLLRLTGRIAQNAVGLVLVVVGIILSLPGVPGQGVLTILIGLLLLEFPGKRRLEQRLVGRPVVHRGINRLRARFRKPPLLLDDLDLPLPDAPPAADCPPDRSAGTMDRVTTPPPSPPAAADTPGR